MKEIIKALMERDELTQQEAEQQVKEVRYLFEQADFDYNECEQIMYDILGLEMDYIFDILY